MTGIGVTLRATDTVFVERLRMEQKDGEWYYVAEVAHNAEPTYFMLTDCSKNGFVCENPDHDFPKKITYSLDGAVLKATISGDGKSIPFVFIRAE